MHRRLLLSMKVRRFLMKVVMVVGDGVLVMLLLISL